MSNNAYVHALDEYINSINEYNDFDLAWRWSGHDTHPVVEVYEQADRHILCGGTIYNIINELADALDDWGLVDVPWKDKLSLTRLGTTE